MADPLHQFEIHKIMPLEIAGVDASFTNSSLFMVIGVVLFSAFMMLAMGRRTVVPGRMQSVAEIFYEFIANMVKEIAGADARPYFPFVFSLFMFILMGNVLGLLPFSFTYTSHIIVTFTLAMIVFVLMWVVGFYRHGLKFVTLFIPPGCPAIMAPLLVPIELFAFFVRPISLSIRLFANMMAGHIMLKVFAGFAVTMGLFGVVPMLVTASLIGFELLVAGLQAYIFALLTCVYLHDSVYMH